MLTHSSASRAVVASFFLLLVAGLFARIALWVYLIPVGGFLAVIIYGSAYVGSSYFLPVICRAVTTKQEIALTFDDGPADQTAVILDILKKHGVEAAFFCTGKNMTMHPELMERIQAEGHVIGNHSYSHAFWFDLFTQKKISDELRQTSLVAEQITGRKLRLFRPPYGVTTPPLAEALRQLELITVGWSIRSLDTASRNGGATDERICARLKPGAIVLLHDTVPATAEHLGPLIDMIRNKGFQPVRLDKLLNIEAYG